MKEKVSPKTILDYHTCSSHENENKSTLKAMNDKYFTFFEYAPIALWIEDFSSVKRYIDGIVQANNTTIPEFIEANPHITSHLASLVTVKEVNNAAVSLYKAKSKKDLIQNLEKVFTPDSNRGFERLVVDLLCGKTENSVETINKTFSNDIINILIKVKIADGSEESLEQVIVSVEDITERVKTRNVLIENALSKKKSDKTKHLLSNTLSSIRDGLVILDANSNYTYVNKKATEFLGKSYDELIGKNIWNEFPERKGDIFYDNYQEAIKTKKPMSFENFYEPWGRWFENRIIPSKDNILIFFDETTERKDNENRIKTAYNIINKSSSVAILCKNEWNFPIEFASENSIQLFGYSHNELLSNKINIHNTVHPDDLEYFRTNVFSLGKKDKSQGFRPRPFRIITKNGEMKWVQANIDIIKNDRNEVTHIQGIVEDITERKKTEDLFFESSQRLKHQFNHTPLASIMWDLDFNLIEWNKSAERIFGYCENEAKGKKIKDLITPPYLVDEMSNIVDNLLNEKGSLRNTNDNLTKNGKIITCDWYNVVLKDTEGNVIGVASLVDDITERVKKERLEEVLYNISKAASIIDNFNNFSVFIKEELNKIIDTRNFYIALYNKESDIITTPVFVDETEQLEEFPAKDTLTGYVIKNNKPLLLKNKDYLKLIEQGEVKLVGKHAAIWVGVPLKIKGEAVGAIVVQNYTNQNAFNENDVNLLEFVADQISTTIQRKKSEKELKDALIKAQESDKLKSSFLANMSHEIRTPMNGIIGFSELFLDSDLSTSQRKKYAEIVIDSSKQLLSIVNDILDISKIEAGVIKLTNENVNLNSLLNILYNFYKPIAEENNIKLKCHKGLKDNLSNIEIDKTKLHQILTNLISNAFKFTDYGEIQFGYELKKDHLEFYVKDTGSGIEEQLQDKIFDRFIQANNDLSKMNKGTGLGLSITKKFIELFNGEIWLSSSKNGTDFYFTIPYSKSSSHLNLQTLIDNKNEVVVNEKEITILVVEDEEYNMMYINELFSKTNFRVIEAYNGKEAIEIFENHPEIDLILMDMKMPIMNGKDAMVSIKKEKPDLPIIALSAFAMETDKTEAINNGFDAYLTKPINKNLLFKKINNFV
ncbi:PAS domain S-box protein [Urechidicola croceus]|uniref:histidine kinase n=1 Tax=Urechidicola croceus TaxID=1850246 RepID=A0A1D8P8T7_9FLAO|nr:PAS domain S-box protein [Urechidicola croceus]AOW20959.1 hypothetical protein LPB138_09855 [Urechidicola croceus]